MPMSFSKNTLDKHANDPNFMLSLGKGLVVLRAALIAGPNVSIRELSDTTGLSIASVRRCVYTLSRLGCWIGNSHLPIVASQTKPPIERGFSSGRLRNVAAMTFPRLRRTAQECFSLTVLVDWRVRCLAKTPTRTQPVLDRFFRYDHEPHLSAIGRALLRELPREQLNQFLRVCHTRHGDMSAVIESLIRIEYERLEPEKPSSHSSICEFHVRSIALPIIHRGTALATVNCSSVQLSESYSLFTERHISQLQDAALRMTELLDTMDDQSAVEVRSDAG